MKTNVHFDVLIIGGGQAGLAAGYHLQKMNKSFAVLDANPRIGDSWRTRYDSLVLFTPRSYSALPGRPMEGQQEQFPTKDDIADYLEQYAAHWALPVYLNTKVEKLTKEQSVFKVYTNQGIYSAEQIIVASGPFQTPSIPDVASQLPESVIQMHSSQYKNPLQLQNGPALVVGGGNSGAQIAVELAKSRDVYIAVSHSMRFLPLHVGSISIFTWFRRLGLLNADRDTIIGRWFRKQPDPIFGFDLKELFRTKRIHLKPKVIGSKENNVVFQDETTLSVPNVVWSTGFKPTFDWIQISDAVDINGMPNHQRGVSPVSGLFFVGLPWQSSRSSALIGGVGKDAEYIISKI